MLSSWFQIPREVEPYSHLASIYDYVMRHVNYQQWASYVSRLFLKADIPVKSVLDIACGTGTLIMLLAESGFNVAGFDKSEHMLKVARKKVHANGSLIPIWCGSMTGFEIKKRFDALVCIYDSINYCLDLNAWVSAMECCSRALHTGGVLIFDICTEKNSRKNFSDYYDKEKTDDFLYARRSYYLKKHKYQINEFVIKWNSDNSTSYQEIHRQRIYSIEDIRNTIPSRQFQISGIYDGFSMRPGTEKSNRVHFVLKKL